MYIYTHNTRTHTHTTVCKSDSILAEDCEQVLVENCGTFWVYNGTLLQYPEDLPQNMSACTAMCVCVCCLLVCVFVSSSARARVCVCVSVCVYASVQ